MAILDNQNLQDIIHETLRFVKFAVRIVQCL
jgi:hypothetical protein